MKIARAPLPFNPALASGPLLATFPPLTQVWPLGLLPTQTSQQTLNANLFLRCLQRYKLMFKMSLTKSILG